MQLLQLLTKQLAVIVEELIIPVLLVDCSVACFKANTHPAFLGNGISVLGKSRMVAFPKWYERWKILRAFKTFYLYTFFLTDF